MFVVVPILAFAAAQPDLSMLTSEQRRVFDAVAAEEFCNCGSALTLAGCLELRPDCRVAEHLGRLVARMAGANVNENEILGYLSERVMGPFCAVAGRFDLNGAPTLGKSNAPITVVEFADFRCAHCKKAASIVKAAVADDRDVRYVFVPFPLQNHPISVAAAEAAFAAGAQGKFWEMHDALFDAQERDFEPAVLTELARKIGLDVKKFEASLATHEFRDKVMALKQQGVNAGVEGTPAFFVNGLRYEVDTVLYTFSERFAMERDRKRGNCK